jgi:hypothetical protein
MLGATEERDGFPHLYAVMRQRVKVQLRTLP